MLPVQSSIQSIIKVKLVLEIGDQLRIVIHRILGNSLHIQSTRRYQLDINEQAQREELMGKLDNEALY